MTLEPTPERGKNVATLILLVLLVLVGAWLRAYELDKFAPNVDELMHLQIAEGRDLREVWQFSLLETHPPLGHFLRYWWNQLIAPGDIVAARLPSVLLGLLAIPVYFGLGREVGGRAGGLTCAFIAALGYLPVVQSQLVRNYALFILLIGGMMWAFLCLRRDWNARNLALYAILSLLSVLTHFGGVLLVMTTTAFLAVELWRQSRGPSRRLVLWLGINAVPGLLMALLIWFQRPYLAPMLAGSHEGYLTRLFEGIFLLRVASNLSWPQTTSIGFIFALWPVMLCLPASWRQPQFRPMLLLFLAALGMATLLNVLGVYPIDDYDRRHLWLMAPLAPLIAIAGAGIRDHNRELITKIARPPALFDYLMVSITALLLIGGSIAYLYYARGQLHKDPQEFSLTQQSLSELRNHLREETRPEDILVADFHVALYFFDGDLNLYRQRWKYLDINTIVARPLGRGVIRTQPNRRYIRSIQDYRDFATAALHHEPGNAGYRVFIVNWALTNPWQQTLFDFETEKRLKLTPRIFDHLHEGDHPEVTVYTFDGDVFLNEMQSLK
jgi:uncharacterized membrane protein